MPEEIKVSRPQGQPSGQPMARPEHYRAASADTDGDRQEPGSKMPWIVLGVIIVVLVVVGVLFRDKLFGPKNVMPDMGSDVSAYQAVFLTNGQVYFGQLSQANSDYPILTDIYYLQVVQPPLQGQQSGTPAPQSQQSQISLVKLGNELHGPVDEMHISKSQILFYEDLKSDGQVVKAIEAYKANPSGTPAAAAPAAVPAAPAPAAPTK
jgi:hypothetical protein